jgi:hypothetical protein
MNNAFTNRLLKQNFSDVFDSISKNRRTYLERVPEYCELKLGLSDMHAVGGYYGASYDFDHTIHPSEIPCVTVRNKIDQQRTHQNYFVKQRVLSQKQKRQEKEIDQTEDKMYYEKDNVNNILLILFLIVLLITIWLF